METLNTATLLPARIRALIYDFDNTIVGTESINEELFASLLTGEFGVALSSSDVEILHGLPWSGVFDWLATQRGLAAERARIWARFLELKREFLDRDRPRVATGLDRMLALPAAQAIVTGSTRAELEMVMAATGLKEESYDLILCDEDCARGKPDPDGYLQALDRLGVPAEEALVFEDSRPGIESARRAGITVAFVAELAAHDRASHAHLSFDTLADAWEAVRERIRGSTTPARRSAVRR